MRYRSDRRLGIVRGALALSIVALVACGGKGSDAALAEVSRTIDERLRAGDYRQAERLAADACDRAAHTHGENSVALARLQSQLVVALVRNGKGGTPDALTIAEHAARVRETALGRDHLETAQSLHDLGLVRLSRGEFTEALALHTRGLDIRRAARVDDGVVADSLDLVALSRIRLKQFDNAGQALSESLRIREAHADAAPLALAQTLELIAQMHRRSGRFADAESPLERCLALRRRYAPDHPDLVGPLQTLGDLRFLAGDTAAAEQIWRDARERAERGLGPDHVAIAELLNRLGLAEASAGNLPEARAFREHALQIGERWLAPCHPQSAILVNDLAGSFEAEGQYSDARRLYRKASATLDDCAATVGASPEPDTRATAAFNEASVASRMGDWADAERLYRMSVDLWSQALGADHPFVARGLEGLADVAASQGQFDASRRLYEQVLAMRQRTLGRTHPQVAWTLASLAAVLSKANEPVLALRLAAQAVSVFDTSGAGDEPDRLAQALELRGVLQAGAGQLAEGRSSLEKALRERTRIFGPSHPLVAGTEVSLAEVEFAAGASEAALDAALEAEHDARTHLLLTARYLPERVALAYAARRPRGLDLALSAALAVPNRRTQVLDAFIRSRGVVLDELAARTHMLHDTTGPSSASSADARQARQRFANLLVRSLEEPVARTLIDQARQDKEEAERALAAESASERSELARASRGIDDVRRGLPAGSALVSFVQFNRSVTGPWRDPSSRTPSVAAFVLRDGAEVEMVPLGPSARIERLVAAFRAEASGTRLQSGVAAPTAEREYRRAGSALRTAIWDPVAPHLRDAQRVFVVPDGAIGLVPFAALPAGESDYLLERWPAIHYLSTERDLVDAAVPARRGARGMLALGGPAFDDASPPDATAPATRSGSDCAGYPALRFQPLDGTRSEVQEVSRLWAARERSAPARVLLGRDATETAFKQSAHEYQVLHVATHGFFLTDACGPAAAATVRGVGGLTGGRPRPAENPLLLSGLALAGANRRASAAPEGDDGILTAEEVAALDLGGVQWAVLSACDTGVGEVKAGEGVFGLRRAFQIAGARSVIMSLWSVDDESTRAWMRALYEARFERNRSTADAARDASMALLRDRRSRGLATHPFYWAAFVAAGDWH